MGEMDPEYDPHENKLVESYDEDEEDEDVSSDENENTPFNGTKPKHKKVVSLDMSKDIDQNQESGDETNSNQDHQTQSSIVIHDDDANYFLKQIGINEPDYDAEQDDDDDDDDETKDEDVNYQNELNIDILQKLSLNSP